jgi:DinB superfamily
VTAGEARNRNDAPDLEALLESLASARAALLATLEGVTHVAFVRPPSTPLPTSDHLDDGCWSARDVLWHAGLVDDWFRLLIDQGLGGRPLAPWKASTRPDHIETPAFLQEWLAQTRGALLARAHRLSPADLDAEFVLPEGERRAPRDLLADLARHDRDHAAQVRSLLEEVRS